MKNKYYYTNSEIFIYAILLVLSTLPVMMFIAALVLEQIEYYFLPIVALPGIFVVFVSNLLFQSKIRLFKQDIRNNEKKHYLKLTYDKQEWSNFISFVLNENKKRVKKFVLIMFIILCFLILCIKFVPAKDSQVLNAFIYITFTIKITWILSNYIYKIEPLKLAANLPIREIDFYKETILITSNMHLLKIFKSNPLDVKTSIDLVSIGSSVYLSIRDKVNTGEEGDVTHKTKILIPEKEKINKDKIFWSVRSNEF